MSKNSLFYGLFKKKKLLHCIFYGPSGCGKTTLAMLISKVANFSFYRLDATSFRVNDVREIIIKHINKPKKPLLFIDEIHRLSKTQQEILLSPMEKYDIVLIGASLYNPYFTLSQGIRSRAILFKLDPLSSFDLIKILDRAKRIIGFSISKDAKEYLVRLSNGDARYMLNILELLLASTDKIDTNIIKLLSVGSMKNGVNLKGTHYDLISSLIKSIRGSDIDASLYYLALLVGSGESSDFIARRLVILASEDIGNANPNALNLATSTLLAVKNIGYPEASIILSQCVVYLASSPKSNSSYIAIKKASEYVKKNRPLKILENLKSSGNKGYLYPHDYKGWVKQRYLEKDLKFYHSNEIGFERRLSEWISKIKRKDY